MILSICIPTYNQPDALAGLLDSLTPLIGDEIEVLICDDSNNSLTQNLVRSRGYSSNIRYYKRDRLGLDDALIYLVEEAQGDYIWWVGDDYVNPSGVMKILDVLKNDPYISFMWINSADHSNLNLPTHPELKSFYFRDPDHLLEQVELGLLGFITATLFRRDLGLQSLPEARKFVGSAFACMYIVLFVITRAKKLYFLGDICFTSRAKPAGESRWYDQTEVFGISLYRVVNKFRGSFDKGVLNRAINANLQMVLRAILVERALGFHAGFASDKPKIVPLLKVYWKHLIFWKYLPLLILNRFTIKILYRLYKN